MPIKSEPRDAGKTEVNVSLKYGEGTSREGGSNKPHLSGIDGKGQRPGHAQPGKSSFKRFKKLGY